MNEPSFHPLRERPFSPRKPESAEHSYWAKEFFELKERYLDSGLDIYLPDEVFQKHFLNFLSLIYIRQLYCSRLFHLGQAAHIIIECRRIIPASFEDADLFSPFFELIETTHAQRDNPRNPALCARAYRIIEKQYPTIRLAELAKELQVNASYLSRVLSQETGAGFTDLVQIKRILEGTILIEENKKASLDWLAEILGYSSAHYLYCSFKKYTGLSPREIKNLI